MLYYKRVKRKALYRERLIPLPVPEFYEFSLADPNLPPIQKLRLSEAFPKNIPFEAPLELIVTRLNISYN